MPRLLARALIPVAVVAFLLPCFGQTPVVSGEPTKTWHIRRISDAHIKIDGELDEPVWQTIDPIRDFTQTNPDLGAPASERTEVRIFYDDQNLYLGFKCFDREPRKVTHRLGAHDAFTGSDSVDFILDTFHDRHTAYYFSINDLGIQFDGLMNESSGGSGFQLVDPTWDGIWYSAGKMQSWGWSVEVAIPFKSIRISRDPEQVWGFNVSRSVVRKNETASWVPVSRFDGVMKPSKAGILTGFEDLHIGRNLELIPYFITSYRRSDWLPTLNGATGSGGLDLRYGITQNLTLSATFNPDFADTEADEFATELSRFEIFFPEKRKFFTEGVNYFQTPMDLFFTRRVGARLPNGEPQSIYEGAKVTGRQSGWTVGALEALTVRTDFFDPNTGVFETAPGAAFGVLRLSHNFLEKSSFGFLSVNRIQQQDIFRDFDGNIISESESTQAFDVNILHGQHVTWASQAMMNLNALDPGFNPQHLGWESNFTYDSESFTYTTGGKFLGRQVNVFSTGFEPETDRWSGYMSAEYKPFINRYGIRQIFATLNYDQANDTEGKIEDAGADAILSLQFKNFWTFQAMHNYNRTRFWEFTPAFLRVCQVNLSCTHLYITPRYNFQLQTNNNRPVFVSFSYTTDKMVEFVQNFYGKEHVFALNVSVRGGPHLKWDMSGVLHRESLLNGVFFQDRRFLINRIAYQFTPKWHIRALAQYEDDINGVNLSVNSLLAYDFTARSAFFLGYNHQRHVPLQPSDLGNQVFVKFSYLIGY